MLQLFSETRHLRFEQYVFGEGAQLPEHIPAERHGILGTLSAEQLAGLRAHLAKRLAR